jgi:hypothetical protein
MNRNLKTALAVSIAFALAGCASLGLTGPSLPEIQAAGNTLVTTIKTDVALYEAQVTVDPATQAKITIAVNGLTAANVVLQGLTSSSATPSGYITVAQSVVSAAVSVVNALPSGTLPAATVQEIDAAGLAFQLAAGVAQQVLVSTGAPTPAQ